MKKTLLLLFGYLWLLANPLIAADLTCPLILQQIVPSDAQAHVFSWLNNTGKTIYVREAQIQLYVEQYTFNGVVLCGMNRNSDGSNLLYRSFAIWQPESPGTITEQFNSNYFSLSPGDGVTMLFLSTDPGGNPQPGFSILVLAYLYYSTSI